MDYPRLPNRIGHLPVRHEQQNRILSVHLVNQSDPAVLRARSVSFPGGLDRQVGSTTYSLELFACWGCPAGEGTVICPQPSVFWPCAVPCRASGLFWHSLEDVPAVGVAALACVLQPMEYHGACSSEPSGCRVSGTRAPGACRLAGEIASCERCREVLYFISVHFKFKFRVLVPTSRRDYRKSPQGKRVRTPWRSTCDGVPRDKCVMGRPGFGREVVFSRATTTSAGFT